MKILADKYQVIGPVNGYPMTTNVVVVVVVGFLVVTIFYSTKPFSFHNRS